MMNQNALKVFGTAESLEAQVDEFLDHVEEAGTLLLASIKTYLEVGSDGRFIASQDKIETVHQRCDELLRAIESQCYVELISPDLRSNLLSLFEQLSGLIIIIRNAMSRLSSEQPNISIVFHSHFISVTEAAVQCIESMVASSRSHLRGKEDVRDNIYKTIFHDGETENLNTIFRISVFSSQLPQIDKIQHRYFADLITMIANKAETIARGIAVFAVKGAF